MQLRIHFESSADVNESGICASLDNLQAFIEATFENIHLPEELGRFINASTFERVIVSKPGDENCSSYITIIDPAAYNEDLYEEYLPSDFNKGYDVSYVNDDAITIRNNVSIGGCFSANIELTINASDIDDIAEKILEDDKITAFDSIELILHSAYQQRQVELTRWLHGYLIEMFGDGSVELKDFSDNGLISISYA